MPMTRVHRSARVGGGSPDGSGASFGLGAANAGVDQDGAISAERCCARCDTRYAIDINPFERVKIASAGSTCTQCEPASRNAAPVTVQPAVVRPVQTIKMWWASRQDVLPELEIRRLTVTDGATEVWQPGARRVVQAGRPDLWHTHDKLHAAAADAIADMLGADIASRIATAWRPEYCQMLATQSNILRRVAAMMGDEAFHGLQVLLRLVGAPAPVAAITVEVLGRICARPENLSFTHAAYAMEVAGVALCLGTGQMGKCVAANSVAELSAPEPVSAEQLWQVVHNWIESALAERPRMLPFEETMTLFLDGAERSSEVFVGRSLEPPESADQPGQPKRQDRTDQPEQPGLAGVQEMLQVGPPSGPFVFGLRPNVWRS
jgi:hypothetical protein